MFVPVPVAASFVCVAESAEDRVWRCGSRGGGGRGIRGGRERD